MIIALIIAFCDAFGNSYSVIVFEMSTSRRRRSFGARRNDRFRPINVRIARLELGFEFHFKACKIDNVPARKLPKAIRLVARRMFKTGDEMHGIVAHLVRRHFGFEIKRAEIAVAAPGGDEFGVQIKDALARKIDNAQVGVTGALHFAFGGWRKIAANAGGSVEELTERVLKITAHLVDSFDFLDRTVRRVQSFQCLVAGRADGFDRSEEHTSELQSRL